jgi:hypothetical protein
MNSQVSFALTQEPDGNVLLRLNLPRPDMPGWAIPAVSGTPIPPDQMSMFRQMFVGGRLSIVVEPIGELVRTTSPYVDGSRVTLIDVNVDDLLMDDTSILRLQAAGTPDDVKAALQDLPGAKVTVDPQVMIEFTPAK